jgi:hypothetical protein
MEMQLKEELHVLNDSWCLWAHLPHDIDWSLNSYKNIYTFNSQEETIELIKNIPEKCVKNCMLFIMRKDINPIWEDPNNKDGGSFSYKILNKNVKDVWKQLTYALVGESLIDCSGANANKDTNINLLINGITISPKKNFCIIKIWLKNCKYQDPSILNKNLDIDCASCIFKKHIV